jgi:hypothetical protein
MMEGTAADMLSLIMLIQLAESRLYNFTPVKKVDTRRVEIHLRVDGEPS